MTSRPEQRLLAVFAHPDDETIGAGSLLALAAAAGVDVSVVTCTRGERGEIIPPDLAHLDPDQLAGHRQGELTTALAELGVHRHLFLDQVPGLPEARPGRFRDSGMRWVRPGLAGPGQDAGPQAFTAVPVDVAARLLAVVIRHVRPTAVVTEEPGGGYGHPDHVHAHRVTMRAVELAAAHDQAAPLVDLQPWTVPTVLWVAQDAADLRQALATLGEHVARTGAPHTPHGTAITVPDPSVDLPGAAVPATEIGAALDARPVRDRVLAALRAHRSQVQAVAALGDTPGVVGHLALSNATLMPVLDRVYLRAAPGSDTAEIAAVLAAGGEPQVADLPAAASASALPTPAASAALPSAAPRRRGPLARLVTSGGATGVVVSVVAGLVMAALGTVVHRYTLEGWPAGIALALAGVLAAAVAARAMAGGGGLLLAALAVVVVTQAMAFLRPGGDILVTNEVISYVWLFGAPFACIAAALLPARWFAAGTRPPERTS